MTATNNSISMKFPTHLLPVLEAKVVKLNRKALRNGFDLVNVSYGEVSYVYKGISPNAGRFTFKSEEDYKKSTRPKWAIEATQVECTYASVGFDGYRMIGVTKEHEGIDILNTIDDNFDLSGFRGTCVCDHCGINRNRKKVYFVANEADEVTRLGSSCVSLFFKGEANALNHFQFDEDLNDLMSSMNDDMVWDGEYEGKAAPKLYSVETVVGYTLWSASKHGYTSVSKANNDPTGQATSTKTMVAYSMDSDDAKDKPTQQQLDNLKDEVTDLIEWAVSKNGENEFFDNVNQVIKRGYVPAKLMGYVVGIYGWFNADKTKKMVVESSTSEWVGEVTTEGEPVKKFNFKGVVKDTKTFATMFGTGHLTTIDCDGNVVTYFNLFKKRGNDYTASVGDTVEFTAKVKEHTTYQGIKQTAITRPSKLNIVIGS